MEGGGALLGRTQLVSEVQWLLSSTSSLAYEHQRVALQALWRGPREEEGCRSGQRRGKINSKSLVWSSQLIWNPPPPFYGINGLLPD